MWNQFHTGDPQISVATMHSLVAQVIWIPVFVHPWDIRKNTVTRTSFCCLCPFGFSEQEELNATTSRSPYRRHKYKWVLDGSTERSFMTCYLLLNFTRSIAWFLMLFWPFDWALRLSAVWMTGLDFGGVTVSKSLNACCAWNCDSKNMWQKFLTLCNNHISDHIHS